MATTAWKAPGTAVSVARTGGYEWGNPDNVKTDDTNYAIINDKFGANSESEWLRMTNFGFSTSDLPVGSTIDGIEVQHKIRNNMSTAEHCKDLYIYLRKTSGQVGDNKASANNWPRTAKETWTYGGVSDTWNASLLDSDVRSSDFGVDLAILMVSSSCSPRMYFNQIRIHYTEASPVTHEGSAFFPFM